MSTDLQPLPKYTKEELLARAEAGRLGIANGEYIEFDDMMRELEEDDACSSTLSLNNELN